MPDNPRAATAVTTFRLTRAEKAELQQLAAREGLTVSEWLRDAIEARRERRVIRPNQRRRMLSTSPQHAYN